MFVAHAQRQRQRIIHAPTILREVRLAIEFGIIGRAAEIAARAACAGAGAAEIIYEIRKLREAATAAIGQQAALDYWRELARPLHHLFRSKAERVIAAYVCDGVLKQVIVRHAALWNVGLHADVRGGGRKAWAEVVTG